MYTTIRPHPLLLPYIDAYWVAVSSRFAQQRILPDTCSDIIFNIGKDAVYPGAGGLIVTPGDAFVVGTMTTFRDTQLPAGGALLGIRFQAGGLAAYTGLPLQLITDQHIPLDEITREWQNSLKSLLEKAATIPQQIRVVEIFLLQRLPVPVIAIQQVLPTIDRIRATNGNIRIAALAAQACMSVRTYERYFLQLTGVSPKTFSRIIRFMAVKQQLKTAADQPLLRLALDNGFYDHAHLTREFSAFTGHSPVSYLQR
ncbi:AraC family transcriptional regulator [Chitinophaga nivalis]|uniref:Helix-turn-helix domain-containing protein n=1 Tax=Chitinophaga nivalis TaxID=2991709 RepID=A0ABT3IVM7_9BACT|nr:helix-turn-helix domain-containing protein [Chitinophaga nivalis]MCW3462315.1 helix-turn-helix domain-containing protein [Chitinophaga nivalis]MCW3487994.1 helix-turn-helix domain-containing protein [Chitinophaga nivalis]